MNTEAHYDDQDGENLADEAHRGRCPVSGNDFAKWRSNDRETVSVIVTLAQFPMLNQNA